MSKRKADEEEGSTIDWMEEWGGDKGDFSMIDDRTPGYCRCPKVCKGSNEPIEGRAFIRHMMQQDVPANHHSRRLENSSPALSSALGDASWSSPPIDNSDHSMYDAEHTVWTAPAMAGGAQGGDDSEDQYTSLYWNPWAPADDGFSLMLGDDDGAMPSDGAEVGTSGGARAELDKRLETIQSSLEGLDRDSDQGDGNEAGEDEMDVLDEGRQGGPASVVPDDVQISTEETARPSPYAAYVEDVPEDEDNEDNIGYGDGIDPPSTLPPIDRSILKDFWPSLRYPNGQKYKWPTPIPEYILTPWYSGRFSCPFVGIPPPSLPKFSLARAILPTITHALAGSFNVARRPLEMTMQAAQLLVKMQQRAQHEKTLEILKAAGITDLSLLQSLDPVNDEPLIHKTLDAVMKSLGVDRHIIVHPQCPNSDCHEVFYEFVRGTEKGNPFDGLPSKCLACFENLYTPDRKKCLALNFGRRTFRQELGVVLRMLGIEELLEDQAEMKDARDREDERIRNAFRATPGGARYTKVYREMDDGSAWDHTPRDKKALWIRLILSIDWANPHSNRSTGASSMGPITAQIANLSTLLRSSLPCMLFLGITPGPKEPKARNLWKLLLPLMLELREAETKGLWICTPKYPEGRLIKLTLECVCCDRPAACAISGAGSFSAAETPCLRCMVHKSKIADVDTVHPLRNSQDHTHNMLRQINGLSKHLAAAERDHYASQDGTTRRTGWTKTRAAAATQAFLEERGNLSALDLLPYLDKFAATVFDPMHAILEGALKSLIYHTFQLGSHGVYKSSPSSRPNPGRGAHADHADPEAEGAQDGPDLDDGQSDAGSEAGSVISVDSVGAEEDAAAQKLIAEGAKILERAREQGADPKVVKDLEGRLAGLKRKPKLTPIWNERDIEFIQRYLRDRIITPRHLTKLHPKFASKSGGSPSADQWRAAGDTYLPFILPVLYASHQVGSPITRPNKRLIPEDLDASMSLFEIVNLACRSAISNIQVDKLESLIQSWRKKAYTLHPSLTRSTNLHVLSHLCADIRRYGSVYNFWNFGAERANKVIKSTNRSGGSADQAQVVAYRALCALRDVPRVVAELLLPERATNALEKAAQKDLKELFTRYLPRQITTIVGQLGQIYRKIRDSVSATAGLHYAGLYPVRLSARRIDNPVPPLVKALLVEYYEKTAQAQAKAVKRPSKTFTTMRSKKLEQGEFFVPDEALFFAKMEFGNYRFDAAEFSKDLGINETGRFTDSSDRLRDSLVEIRTDPQRYDLVDTRVFTGVLLSIFEHAVINQSGLASSPILFGVFRVLVEESRLGDPYLYRRYPGLNMWIWRAKRFGPVRVMALTSGMLAAFRPVAMAQLPVVIGKQVKDDIWVTKPLHRNG